MAVGGKGTQKEIKDAQEKQCKIEEEKLKVQEGIKKLEDAERKQLEYLISKFKVLDEKLDESLKSKGN